MKKLNTAAMCCLILAMSLLSACGGGGTPQLSPAAEKQYTESGIEIGTETGVPTKPTVEYVRISTDRSIFLDPPEEDDPAVYVRVRDTSGQDWNLQQAVIDRVRRNGFRIAKSIRNAVYVLQANVLLAHEVSALELAKLDETEYGQDVSSIAKNALTGAAIGGVAGGLAGDSEAAIGGALAGGLLGGILEASDQSNREQRLKAKQHTKYYSLIVDIELRQRAHGIVRRSGSSSQSSSTGGSQDSSSAGIALSGHQLEESNESYSSEETETYSETSEWKRHRARILGKAKGKLIAFEDVQGDFAKKLTSAISDMF